MLWIARRGRARNSHLHCSYLFRLTSPFTDRVLSELEGHGSEPVERNDTIMALGNGSREWKEETVHVDGTDLVVVKGGTGDPLLVLHEELGWPGWLR